MPLQARDSIHHEQIQAGTVGRLKGHHFEKELTKWLNSFTYPEDLLHRQRRHLILGHPALELVRYICLTEKITEIKSVKASWLGGLATYKEGDIVNNDKSQPVRKSKSDILLEISFQKDKVVKKGVSVKTCNKKTPTNDQLFLSTAIRFCELLSSHGINVSQKGKLALQMFCGDIGFRPMDTCSKELLCRQDTNPERYFWEELPENGRNEWEQILAKNQNMITAILLQNAYTDDPYPPEYLLHQRVKYDDINDCPLAIFRIDELIEFSSKYAGFYKNQYKVKKGRFKDDPNTHEAPRFGFIQFQRFGNVQNATELQFNLKAGYFNLISMLEKKTICDLDEFASSD